MKQIPLALALDEPPRLDNLIAGANRVALAHVQQALQQGDLPGTPTYLWGDKGSGKTHYLRAIRTALQEQGMAFGWLDAQTTRVPEFDMQWQAVLLDDVDLFDAARQHTAFNWFVNAMTPAEGPPRWVVAAGALPVADLPVREDLRTRLGWGQVFGLQPLSDADVAQALRQAAQQRGLVLGDGLLAYMQTRFARSTGSLMALLERLDAYALQTRRPLTIALFRQMLNEETTETH
ncbi:MAG: DnaA/Hda family protein [Brachymonas sp.]|nr:DnaA/Hda family protein [Brachymonas sp.]